MPDGMPEGHCSLLLFFRSRRSPTFAFVRIVTARLKGGRVLLSALDLTLNGESRLLLRRVKTATTTMMLTLSLHYLAVAK